MRKTIYAFGLIALVTLAGVAFAAATKYDFVNKAPAGSAEADAVGFVVVNYAKGKDKTVWNIQCFGLAGKTEYTVKRGGVAVAMFETNKKGHGHVNVQQDGDQTSGGAVNIRRADDNKRVLRAKLP
jgi:hypothetical protein